MMNNKIVRTEKGFKEFFNNAIRQFNEKYNSDIEEINFPVVFATKSEMKNALGGYSYYMDKITGECIPYRFAFSKNIIQTVKEDNLNTILLHELGHYIATESFGSQPFGGHSEKWEKICAMLGLEEHNISPTTIKKKVRDTIEATIVADEETIYGIKETDNIDEIKENIASLQAEMMEAAQNLQFERAAELRDKIKQLEERINS